VDGASYGLHRSPRFPARRRPDARGVEWDRKSREFEVEALELIPVYERESPGLGVAFVAEVERTT